MRRQIHIVEDDPDIRETVIEILRPLGFPCTGYGDGEDFLRQWRGELYGCMLLDMRLPGRTGLEILSELKEAAKVLPVILFTSLVDMQMAVDAMKAGAYDFIAKPFTPNSLTSKVEAALKFNEQMLNDHHLHVDVVSALSQLTTREREILDYIVEGRTSRNIASTLGISSYTVDNHRARILDKMRASSTGQLVQMVCTATISLKKT